MQIVCLDLEGVLIPEMWLEVAERTGISELRLTTRDVADYDELMRHRLNVLAANGVTLFDIKAITKTTAPLPGAFEFLNRLRRRYQVAILSDTYVEFIDSVMERLGHPFLLCNTLETDRHGTVTEYRLRQENGKQRAVELFRQMNNTVAAAGDSFNDIAMLRAADRSVLFRPSKMVQDTHPDLPVATTYQELEAQLSPER
jgi:phosphoserine/homoserine phosphotransferase